jgi:hypothetical protein
MHTRIRKFNTRDTYPEQQLDTIFVRPWWPGAARCSCADKSDKIWTPPSM